MDHDAVTCYNPRAIVHDCKHRVDGITKYLSNQEFVFDHVFGPDEETSDVYECVARPLVDFVARGGRATVFAYGQTGSGKTFTMLGPDGAIDAVRPAPHHGRHLRAQPRRQ